MEQTSLWTGFQKPKRLVPDTETLTETYGKFSAQPFERIQSWPELATWIHKQR